MIEPEEIFREQLHKIAGEENLSDYQIEITPASSDGANYMSVNFKAKIISPNRPDLKLFAKIGFFSEAMRAQVPIDVLYGKEIATYTQILPRYEEIQEKNRIPKEDRYQFAKLYGSSTEYLKECVIMEDLGAQGYRLYDRFQPFSWEYASKAVEELSKYHALSLALKKDFPEVCQDIFKQDEELFDSFFEKMEVSLMGMVQTALSIVSDELKERLLKFYKENLSAEGFKNIYAPSKHGIIVHGDYRASNILFKRQGGKLKGFVPIDYQGVRLGSPSADLLYLIYSGTDAKFRKLHLKQLVDFYYKSFAKFLRLLNLDPDQEFSRQDFDDDYKKVHAVGLITAIMTLPVVLVDSSNIPLTTSAEGGDMTALSNLKGTQAFKDRFLPILNEYINYGLL